MKKLFGISTVIIMLCFMACNNSEQETQQNKLDSLNLKLEKLHNTSMAKYVQIQLYLDSLESRKKESDNDSVKEAISEVSNKGTNAYKSMADWMKNFKNLDDEHLDKKVDYLGSQLDLVKEIDEKLDESINSSKDILKETSISEKQDSVKSN